MATTIGSNNFNNTTIAMTTISSMMEENHTQNHEKHPYFIVFIFGSTGFGAILRILLRKWADYISEKRFGSLLKLPYTVFLLIVGMIFSAIGIAFPDDVRPYLLTEIDPELFLHVFLPVVIFESAYVIDIHVFWRAFGHVSILAVPGLLMATFLTAGLSLVLPELSAVMDTKAKIYIAVMFGAIISATDPVAVVALLKELGCQKYLSTIIEGEALLNDGAAIVVFKISLELLKSMTPYFEDQTGLTTFQLIVQQSLLGPVIGWLAGKVATLILQKIYNDALAEITVTLSFTYLTFYIAEVCKTSGVLAVVTFGLALDRSSITPQVDHFLHRFWEMLAYLSNTLIFVIVGVVIVENLENISRFDFGYLMVIYVGITAIRTVSIFSFYPIMRRLGIDLDWRHFFIMIWGGLRGAVGLALALYLSSYAKLLSGEEHILRSHSNDTKSGNESIEARHNPFDVIDDPTKDINFKLLFKKILIHTGGIVLLTLVINASTVEFVLRQLGLLDVTHAQQVTMHNAINRIQGNLKRTVAILKYDRFLADARWNMVEDMTQIEYPYKDMPSGKESLDGFDFDDLHICNSEDLTYKDLFEEARLRMIKALKMSYGKQYSHGLISDQEARVLIAAADNAADIPGEFINVEQVRKNWEITGILPYVKKKIEYWMYGRKVIALIPPRNKHRRRIFYIATSDTFEYLMQLVIIINIIPISLDFAVNETWHNAEGWVYALDVINIVFIAIYTLEVALKMIGMGAKQCVTSSRWNQFDILILFISYLELILDSLLSGSGPGTGNIVKTVKTTKVLKFGKVTKIIRTLRATRVLRLTKTILPRTVDFINRRINKRLSFGYNVGKGFVTAEEEVNKLITSICENVKIQRRLLQASDSNRLSVTKEMGLLQRDHPGIAVSVKTRNAIRTILNSSLDAIQQLCAGGVLDETEMQLLERGVEIKQKRLADFPSSIAPSQPEDIIENLLWIKDNPGLLAFVKQHAVCMDYDYGDVILDENEEVEGIHVIVYGMIRLVGTLQGHIQKVRAHSVVEKKVEELLAQTSDSISSEHEEDFLGSGNIFGDVALLTKTNMMCTISCETAVQTYFISAEDMESAFELFPDLKKTMWKVAAIRIATSLYLEHIEYHGVGLEQIHLHLAQGFIIELNDSNPKFTFNETIMEVSVIYGSVCVKLTKEIMHAPVLLLPEYEEIRLFDTPSVVLLAIPREANAIEFTHSSAAINRARKSVIASMSRVARPGARKTSQVHPIMGELLEEKDEEMKSNERIRSANRTVSERDTLKPEMANTKNSLLPTFYERLGRSLDMNADYTENSSFEGDADSDLVNANSETKTEVV